MNLLKSLLWRTCSFFCVATMGYS